MCTQKVPYCYMPINIFVIALLKNMNLVCPVIAAFAEISTSFNTKLTHNWPAPCVMPPDRALGQLQPILDRSSPVHPLSLSDG